MTKMRFVNTIFPPLVVLMIFSCGDEAEGPGGGALIDSGNGISDADAKPMDGETPPTDGEASIADSANTVVDAEASIEDDASDEEECEPGGVYGGLTEDQFDNPKIRTMSDLALLEGYEILKTDLFIPFDPREETEIDSLSYLRCLTNVSGLCRIGPAKALENLDGLENLTEVGWEMSIGSNDSLTNVDGLIGLKAVGRGAARGVEHPGYGALSIRNNNSLLDLKGLANLSYLYGFLVIENNKSLPTCEAIALKEQLEKAGWTGEATICGNLADECDSDPCPSE